MIIPIVHGNGNDQMVSALPNLSCISYKVEGSSGVFEPIGIERLITDNSARSPKLCIQPRHIGRTVKSATVVMFTS